jgi:hypothetical protein
MYVCCYIYKFNIGTTDILTSLNILIEILIMIMQYLFFSFSINHNMPTLLVPKAVEEGGAGHFFDE